MFGYVLAGLVGVLASGVVRRAVWHRRWHGHRGGGFRRYAFFSILERLDATPAQEKVVREALDGVKSAMAKGREEAKAARAEVAKLMGKPDVSEEELNQLFARFDAPLDDVKKAFADGFRKVHDALDERQRKLVGEMLEAGPARFAFRRGHHGCGHRRACAPAC